MKKLLTLLTLVFMGVIVAGAGNTTRQRLIVTTDLGGTDPDDIESMVHLLVCSDMVDIEGLISSQVWTDYPDKVDSIKKVVDRFCEVLPNLQRHSAGYPDADYLRSIVKRGQTKSNMDGVGEGKDSPGSEHIIACVDRSNDKRPVWIAAWGGMNNIAQAIWKVRHTRSEKKFREFIGKIRIYDILGQDDAGAWIAHNYPSILYIRNTQIYGWPADDDWVKSHIMRHKPLGDAYPMREWVFEGDSPSFMYLLDNGLNVPEHIDYGGWGGRFDTTPVAGIRGMSFIKRSGKDESQYDPYYMHPSSKEGCAAIWRWKTHIWNDFEARMIWATTPEYGKANYHPVPVVDGDKSRRPLIRKVKPGSTLRLDASRSSDPDNDALAFSWQVYREPGTYKKDVTISNGNASVCDIHIPSDASGSDIHVILEVTDNGTPALTLYRRIIIKVG